MPKRRGSTKRSSVPSSKAKVRCSCGPQGSPSNSSRPDMPRCMSRTAPSSRKHSMYLARRAKREHGPPFEALRRRRLGQGEANVGAALDQTRPRGGPPGAPPGRAWWSRPRAAPASPWFPSAWRLPAPARQPRRLWPAAQDECRYLHERPSPRKQRNCPAPAIRIAWRRSGWPVRSASTRWTRRRRRIGSATSSDASPRATTS